VTRLVIPDPLSGIAGGILVNPGEEAFLVSGGAYLAVMGPGNYPSQWIAERLGKTQGPAFLAIVRKGAVELDFRLKGIRTADPVLIDVTAEVLMRIDKAPLFLDIVTKGNGTCRVGDVHAFLKGPMQNAFSDLFGTKSIKELEKDGAAPQWKKSLEVMLEHGLKTTLQESGLYLAELKSVEYDLRKFNQVVEAREQLFIGNERDDAEAGDLEKRIAVRRKTLDLLGDLSATDEQVEEYLLEEEKARLLKSQELEDIKAALEDRRIDHRVKREWIVRKLELEQELDYERRKLLGKIGIDRDVGEARLALIDVEARLAGIRLENELVLEKTRTLAHIEMNERKEESSLKIMDGLVELKKRKERDAAENELYKEKERCEIRLREKEREMEMRRAMGVPVVPPDPDGR
jgi:hypothetical protein